MEKDFVKNNKGYLKNSGDYKSVLKNGWILSIDYCRRESDDDILSPIEYYINEQQLKKVHECLYEVINYYGVPQVGDFIDAGSDLDKVAERQFTVHDGEKKLVLTLV